MTAVAPTRLHGRARRERIRARHAEQIEARKAYLASFSEETDAHTKPTAAVVADAQQTPAAAPNPTVTAPAQQQQHGRHSGRR